MDPLDTSARALADPAPGERGETLVELLVAIVLMGTALVIILGGLGTSIRVSDIHRKQAVASADLRTFAEALQSAVTASPSSYVECATPASYAGTYSLADARFVAEVTGVRYWDGAVFGSTCVAGTDSGVQQVSLRVRSMDGRVSEHLDVIVRKPCRSIVDYPLDAPCAA